LDESAAAAVERLRKLPQVSEMTVMDARR